MWNDEDCERWRQPAGEVVSRCCPRMQMGRWSESCSAVVEEGRREEGS